MLRTIPLDRAVLYRMRWATRPYMRRNRGQSTSVRGSGKGFGRTTVCSEYDEPDIEIRAAYHSGQHTQRQLGIRSTGQNDHFILRDCRGNSSTRFEGL